MAFEKIRAYQYMADTYEDLVSIADERMGTECYVISEACDYKLMSTGKWIKQVPPGSGDVVIPDIEGIYTEDNFQALSPDDILEICRK